LDSPRQSPYLLRVLGAAEEIARVRGHHFAGTEHLLLAIVRTDRGSFARRLLEELGVAETLQARIEEAIGPDPPEDHEAP
jgi:ATP-dependent Clp protease ATP-binding subunit ClpA